MSLLTEAGKIALNQFIQQEAALVGEATEDDGEEMTEGIGEEITEEAIVEHTGAHVEEGDEEDGEVTATLSSLA